MTRVVLAVAALTLAGIAPPTLADYPDHAIKAVVPFPAGGGTDLFARIVAPPLAKVLGQPVVIENKGGAEGNIGMDMVAKSPPDGYTLLFNSSAAVVNPAMYKTLAFDPLKDLQPVAVLCEYFNLIVVNATTVDAKTLPKDLELTHINLNDQSVEGMRHRKLPVFSVQYHPEAAPGPLDSSHLFQRFREMVLK